MGLFSRSSSKTLLLLDISSGSVGGAYVSVTPKKAPNIIYSTRVVVEDRLAGQELGILRALGSLIHTLVSKGPEIKAATGEGSASEALLAIGSPWHISTVRVEHMEKEKPFTITERLLAETLKEEDAAVIQSESILSAVLNGYQVQDPIGKNVRKADLTILSSRINRELATHISNGIRKVVPLVRSIETPVLIHETVRRAFPHQEDCVVLNVSEEQTDILLMKRGVLVSINTTAFGTHAFERIAKKHGHSSFDMKGTAIDTTPHESEIAEAQSAWVSGMVTELKKTVTEHALPRTVYLITTRESVDFIKGVMDTADIRALWLSDEPATLVPILPERINDPLLDFLVTKVTKEVI